MLVKLLQSSLVRGSATYLAANVLNSVIPFALLPILTRTLSLDDYGTVAMFQTVLTTMCAVAGLSSHSAAGRKYYDRGISQGELAQFIGSCLQVLSGTTVLLLAGLVVVAPLLASWLGIAERWIYMAALAAAANSLIQLRLVQWQVRERAFRYGVFQVTLALLNVIASIVLVVVLHFGSAGRIVGQTGSLMLFGAIGALLLKSDGLVRLTWRPDLIRDALRYGLPLIPHVLGGLALGLYDRFAVNQELGLAGAGIYMVAVQLSASIGLVLDAVNNAYVPWLFERLSRQDPVLDRKIVLTTYAYCGLLLGAAAAAFAVGPLVINIVAGPRYSGAGEIIGWLCVSQALFGMYLMVTNYIFYSKSTGALSIVTAVTGAVDIALLYTLIPRLGLVGAATAAVLANGLRFTLTWRLAQQRHPMPWFSSRAVERRCSYDRSSFPVKLHSSAKEIASNDAVQ